MIKQIAKTLLALAVAAVAVMTVRNYVATVYKVSDNLGSKLRRGDRVIVCKLEHRPVCWGDIVVYRDNDYRLGVVEALPGDTVKLNNERYAIPMSCCRRCTCIGCRLVMLNTARGLRLVYRHQIVGHAHYVFHLPW